MSSVSQDQWTPSRLLPSVIFVLTPCIAVGLLVCWSIRLQLVRRRWRAEMARVNPARSDSVIGLKDRPPLYEVWLESTQGSPKPDGIGKYTMPGDTRTDSLLPSQTGSMEHYSWQTILVSYHLVPSQLLPGRLFHHFPSLLHSANR